MIMLSGCAFYPYIITATAAGKELVEGMGEYEKDKTNEKICSIISQEFANTTNPWKSYQNISESMLSSVSEDKKEEAKDKYNAMKAAFAKIKTQTAIDQELSNFENDVKSKDGFDCPPETQALVTRKLDEYWDQLKQEDEDKKIKEYNAKIKSIEKKYGYKFCPEPSTIMTYFITGRPIPSNCILVAGDIDFLIFQQVNGGTLLQFRTPNYMIGQIVFVSRNNTDAELPDNVAAPGGYFVRTGSYKYSSVLGAGKTVYKLKRLESF